MGWVESVPEDGPHSADLEVGDTAGLETCATTAGASASAARTVLVGHSKQCMKLN